MPERIDLLKLERRFVLYRKSGRSTTFLDLCANPVIFGSYGAYIPRYWDWIAWIVLRRINSIIPNPFMTIWNGSSLKSIICRKWWVFERSVPWAYNGRSPFYFKLEIVLFPRSIYKFWCIADVCSWITEKQILKLRMLRKPRVWSNFFLQQLYSYFKSLVLKVISVFIRTKQ